MALYLYSIWIDSSEAKDRSLLADLISDARRYGRDYELEFSGTPDEYEDDETDRAMCEIIKSGTH